MYKHKHIGIYGRSLVNILVNFGKVSLSLYFSQFRSVVSVDRLEGTAFGSESV